jgi:hypothetical protein
MDKIEIIIIDKDNGSFIARYKSSIKPTEKNRIKIKKGWEKMTNRQIDVFFIYEEKVQ